MKGTNQKSRETRKVPRLGEEREGLTSAATDPDGRRSRRPTCPRHRPGDGACWQRRYLRDATSLAHPNTASDPLRSGAGAIGLGVDTSRLARFRRRTMRHMTIAVKAHACACSVTVTPAPCVPGVRRVIPPECCDCLPADSVPTRAANEGPSQTDVGPVGVQPNVIARDVACPGAIAQL